MRSKTIMCCLLATVLMAGTAASGACAFAANAESNTVFSDNAEVSQKFSFKWDRSDNNGITLKLGTSFDEAVLIRNNRLFASTLNSDITIKKGEITIGVSLLAKLDDGENTLTFVLKEGTFNIEVNVTDSRTDVPVEEITAENTDFEWDRNDFLGIAVKTNSKSKKVTVMKDGQKLAEDTDREVYILLGRVSITAKVLKGLDDGENKLSLVLDDGTVDINVKVTDRKKASSAEITADKTEFTWDRNSSQNIVVKTNSKSQTVAVRKSGTLFSDSDTKNISVSEGTVTITPDFLNTLDDGKNTLKLVFDDGRVDINIAVTGSEISSKTSDNSSLNSVVWTNSNSAVIGTGNSELTIGTALAALLAGLAGMIALRKKSK